MARPKVSKESNSDKKGDDEEVKYNAADLVRGDHLRRLSMAICSVSKRRDDSSKISIL